MENIGSLISLSISDILIILISIIISITQKKKSQLKVAFLIMLFLLCTWTTSLILKILFQASAIDPFFFEQLTGLGLLYSPVAFYAITSIFTKTKIKLGKKHLLFIIIPTVSLLFLLTNNKYHLIFKSYSTYMSGIVGTPYYSIQLLYSYILYIIGMFNLLKYSLKNSGFFSKQSLLIILGTSIPLIVNILGFLGIIKLTTYATPITFSAAMIIYALAIFKFKFIGVTPIALQKIVDRISDGYVVLNENNNIIDFNQTFTNMFKLSANNIRNQNIFDLIEKYNYFDIEKNDLKKSILKVRKSMETIKYEIKIEKIEKFFNLEINSIESKGTFVGTLMLFKDTTQHMLDMDTIKSSQSQLIEQERLASLGQMIGGIAHNLKTPIMSISGAAEGIKDLVNEYDASIGNPMVTYQDYHDIAKDMYKWIDKIKSYTEYMSDIITAVKGQAVALTNDSETTFTLDELIKRIDILMRHELKNAIVYLNVAMKTDPKTILNGDVNSLVQVINNMISNAIQAYNGEANKNIDLILEKKDNYLIISIKDYGPGLPQIVKDKLFKEMVTTKGKNGTGLGLYMSYSNIKAHFNGDITVDSKSGIGTTFNIILPL